MRVLKQNTGVKAYLDSIGILQNGTQEDISKAKKEYWKQYDKLYKRKKRKQKREFLISLNSKELALVVEAAKEKGMRVTEFMREAALAEMQKAYVIPYPHVLKEIAQSLILCKTSIKNIAEKDNKNWLGISRNYENLEAIITKVQTEIQQRFNEAPTLIKVIEDTLQRNPFFIITITNLIEQYHDNQKHNKKNTNLEAAS
jgi:predicted DNA-binding ArsR family transcriptional regulator